MPSRTRLILPIVIVIAIALSIAAAIAFYLSTRPYAELWYVKDNTVYHFDPRTQRALAVNLEYEDEIASPRVSPDGQYVAYNDELGLRIALVTGGENRLIVPDAKEDITQLQTTIFSVPLSWSQDSKWLLVYRFVWEFYYLDLVSVTDGTAYSFDNPAMGGMGLIDQDITDLSWHPESKSFATGIGSLFDGGGLYTVSTENQSMERIYFESIPFGQDLSWVHEGGVSEFRWNSTGEWLAVTSEGLNSLFESSTLFLVSADGSHSETLVDAGADKQIMNPVWSPDDQQIFYLAVDPDQQRVRSKTYFPYDKSYYGLDQLLDENLGASSRDEIYVVDVNSEATTLVYSAPYLELLAISPDGEWLTIIQRQSALDHYSLWLVSVKTSETVQVTEFGTESSSTGFMGWSMGHP